MKTLLIGINAKYIHPAMGIFQIHSNSQHPTEIKEFTIKDDLNNILNFIENANFDVLGFSVYIWNTSFIQEIISELKHLKTIILGGPEASYRVNDFLKFKNISFIIKDEGEFAFNALIAELKTTKNFESVPNLYYRKNNAFKYTYPAQPNIKEIKYDYSLINDFKNRIVYLEASRGCPFQCAYCLASLDNKVRYLDIQRVKEDIRYVLNKGAKTIKFLDRSFNTNQVFMRELIKFIQENDNKQTIYQFEIVPDRLDDQSISFLRTLRKGLIRFEVGVQSLNQKTIKSINRVQNNQKLFENILAIKDNIVIHLDLIAGLPYENKESFMKSFNQTFLLFVDELQLGFLKELKGTQISLTRDEHNYKFSKNPPYEIIENQYISKEDLDEIRLVEAGLNKFYNSQNFPRTMNYLFKTLKLNPYQTFLKIVKFIQIAELNKLQHNQVTKKLVESLEDLIFDKEELIFLVKQDYLFKFKQRPKIFWQPQISRKERRKVYLKFIDKYPNLTIDNLYRNAFLDKYKNKYFLIIYKPTKQVYYL